MRSTDRVVLWLAALAAVGVVSLGWAAWRNLSAERDRLTAEARTSRRLGLERSARLLERQTADQLRSDLETGEAWLRASGPVRGEPLEVGMMTAVTDGANRLVWPVDAALVTHESALV
ncbi:MAG: hypothetical protein KDB53_13845, partial [Planctomycetes bacterium]|nr:hypothetical protein [Planctomycetota bacterium]